MELWNKSHSKTSLVDKLLCLHSRSKEEVMQHTTDFTELN